MRDRLARGARGAAAARGARARASATGSGCRARSSARSLLEQLAGCLHLFGRFGPLVHTLLAELARCIYADVEKIPFGATPPSLETLYRRAPYFEMVAELRKEVERLETEIEMQGKGTPMTALLEKRNSALKFFAHRMNWAIVGFLFRGWASYIANTRERIALSKERDTLRFENEVLRDELERSMQSEGSLKALEALRAKLLVVETQRDALKQELTELVETGDGEGGGLSHSRSMSMSTFVDEDEPQPAAEAAEAAAAEAAARARALRARRARGRRRRGRRARRRVRPARRAERQALRRHAGAVIVLRASARGARRRAR